MRRMADSAMGPRLPLRARRSASMRVARLLVRAVELVVIVGVIGVAALAIRLSSGPIYFDALRDRVALSLQDRLAGRYSVDISRMYLVHDSWGVGIGFDGLKLKDPQGRPVLSAPAGRIGLDPLALAFGEVRVRRLRLEGLNLRLHVAKDGTLSIAVSGDASAEPIPLPNSSSSGLESANIAALIRAAAEAMAGPSQAIDHLTLSNGVFAIDNEATGRSVAYKDFNLVFDRYGKEAAAQVSATGPAGPWTINASAEADSTPTLSIEARDISLADLETFNKRQPPVFVEGPIGLRLLARLAPDESLETLDASFTLGAGRVRLNNPDARPFLLDEASGHVAWDATEKRLHIEGLTVLAGETQVKAEGWVAPPAAAADPWTVHMESTNTRFGAERPGTKAVLLNAIALQARIFPLERRFLVDDFSARGPTVGTRIVAEVAPDGPDVSLKLDLTVDPSVTQDVIRLWPQFINPDVRDWCSHNLHGGQIEGEMHANWSARDLDAMDHKRAVSPDSVHGSFASHDVGVDLMPGLPIMTSGEGSGSFTGHEFSLMAKTATMALTPSRKILADNIAFTIPDTSPRQIVDAQAQAHLSGTADALADLLGREPLRKQAGLVLDPATVHGQAEGEMTLALKLGKTAKPEDSGFDAKGTLSNLTIEKFIGEEKLEQGSFTFEADRSTLKMSGQGQLFGAATRIDVARAPGDEGLATLALTLDQAALAKRGLNFAWLSGSLPIRMKAPLTRASATVEMDLTPAGIDNPIPGVVKTAGKPGKATFQAKPAANGAALTDIAIDFGTAMIRGSAEVGPEGSITSAKLTQARISPGDALQADIVVTGGVIKANVRGSALDARPFIKAVNDSGSSPGASGGGGDLDLDVKVSAATGANKQAVTSLEANLSQRGGDIRAVSARGRIGQGVFSAEMADGGDLKVASTDAGALARFLDIYPRMEGGALNLTLTIGGKTNSGTANIANFVLRDEPALRQLVAAAPARADGVIDPTRVPFQRMSLVFERSPGVLNIKDGVIYNPNMGLTATGRVDFAGDSMDVSGTFIPAYSLNNMLNKIPVLGTLLGGGSNEGVIGISYRVRGSISSPSVSVNPLSAIAPGILRKILGVMDGSSTLTGDGSDDAMRRPAGRR
jgi:hypothetical protein